MDTRQIMDGMAARLRSRPVCRRHRRNRRAGAARFRHAAAARWSRSATATLFAVEQFNLAVTNVVQGVPQNQFFCSGSLLRVEMKERESPRDGGSACQPRDDV